MTHHVGDLVKVTLDEVRNEKGELADPTTLVLKTRSPSDATSEQKWPGGTIERLSLGNFYAPLLLTEEGIWLYEWTATGNVEIGEPGEIPVAADEIDDTDPSPFALPWRPETADVAALIHARTIVPGGQRVGDFTEATEPSGEQVERLINLAVRSVASSTSAEPCNAELRADARAVAAYLAAALVEQSYWPEQSISAQSTFAGLMRLVEQNLGNLEERVEAICGVGSGDGEGEDEIEGGAVVAGHFDDGVEVLGRTWPPPPGW